MTTKGDRIKASRLAKGMTQADLAKKLGVSPQAINKYEKGTVTNIPSDKIDMLCKLLEVPPEYLLGWEQSPQTIEEEQKLLATIAKDKELLKVLRKYYTLSEESREYIRKTIELLPR